jgi:hypothetical protein
MVRLSTVNKGDPSMRKRSAEYVRPANVEEYARSSVEAFLGDPPDTDFQRGYLASLLIVAEEALGLRMDVAPFSQAQKLCLSTTGRMNRVRREMARCFCEMDDLMEGEFN